MKICLKEGKKLVVYHEEDEQEFIMMIAEGKKIKDISTPQKSFADKIGTCVVSSNKGATQEPCKGKQNTTSE